ncbi:Methyltransferase domain-containing protein [Halogranum rubrum]|uniref:Methyltransferase domain-containing protein n=1 Tax=Halogranum rubrum TaxID=553466 RepID=A0A1I4IC34_9EURY|nr:class I SAM-dependent methyltransferase [Halogranum rubrum]SFL51321.1 Methyltransferase domain-containing protein [Halogranum rubrum]
MSDQRRDDHKRDTAASFGAAAEDYFESAVHRGSDDLRTLAAWCADADRALDIATGGGHTAGALAAAGVPFVVAGDVSPEMVTVATREYDVEGALADAERLPVRDDAFDAVTCRIAAHHFPDPESFVSEVARVLEPGGTFAFEDNVAPEEADLATFLNGVERLRDPTHVELYTVEQWREWFESAGLAIETVESAAITLDFEAWVERTDVSEPDRDELRERFREAPEGAHERFAVEFDDAGDVQSFANPKALIRATKR